MGTAKQNHTIIDKDNLTAVRWTTGLFSPTNIRPEHKRADGCLGRLSPEPSQPFSIFRNCYFCSSLQFRQSQGSFTSDAPDLITLTLETLESPPIFKKFQYSTVPHQIWVISRSFCLIVPAMDFMKVLDQTVREIKREVNLKVLKVPETEQKVLDATSDEPWGPHGSALSEIAQATKKFTECQMIMNVLWTRLSDTGSKWRHVYKALAVIEYLIANGSERAVDDILEHTFQISALSGFEYVEPNGKDVGINVRKKAETILALLNDKEKIQAVREKAAATRDKYFGLSSTGITYKSSGASYSSGGFSDRYGSLSGSRDGDTFRDNYGDSELHKSAANKNEVSKSKKPVAHQAW